MTTNHERDRRERREQRPTTSYPAVPAPDTLTPLILATAVDSTPTTSTCDPGPGFGGGDC